MVRSVSVRLVFISCLVAAWLCCLAPAMALADEAGESSAITDVQEQVGAQDATDEPAGAQEPDESSASTEEHDSASATSEDDGQAESAEETPSAPADEPQPATNDEPAADDPEPDPAADDEPAEAQPADDPAADDTADEAAVTKPAEDAAPAASTQEAASAAASAAKAASTTSTAKTASSTPAATAKKTAKKAAKKTAAKVASSGPLADGTYVINFAKSQKLMVSISGASKKGGAKAQMKPDNNKKAQRWVFTWVSKYSAYLIQNVNSKLFLTTKSKSAGRELVVQSSKKSNSKMQMWVLQKSGSTYKIVSAANKGIGLGTWSGKLKDGYYVTVQSKAANKQTFYIMGVNDAVKKPKAAAPDNIQDGAVITLALNSKKSLRAAIADADLASGAAAVLSKSASETSQKWYLKAASKGAYQVINLGSNKALQSAAKRYNGAPVTQATRNASSQAQQWWIAQNADGTVSLVNRFNGQTLRIDGSSAKAGTELVVGYKPSAKTSRYQAKEANPVDTGVYEIALRKKTSQALNIPNSSAKSGTQLNSYAYKKYLTQKFKLTRQKDGTYTIRSQYSARYLADKDGKVVQGTADPSKAQTWELVLQDAGLALRNVATGNYLEVKGASTANNAKVVSDAAFSQFGATFAFISRHTIDDGAYFIRAGKNGKYVLGADAANSAKAGAKIKVYKKTDAYTQKFKISYLKTDKQGNEVYKIVNAASNFAVAVAGNGNRASLVQQKYTGNAKQKWALEVSQAGGVLFVNVSSGKAINGTNPTKNASAVNALKKNLKAKNERWTVEETSALSPLALIAYRKILASNGSDTNYAIGVDLSQHWFWVFKRASKSSPWELKYEWRCSNGRSVTPTFAVNLKTSGAKRYKNAKQKADGTYHTTSFYYMTYVANGQYVHTPTYRLGSHTTYKDKRMGMAISGGCIRLMDPNAIWVYKNIKRGTRFIAYYH